jgi:hypothetical protein
MKSDFTSCAGTKPWVRYINLEGNRLPTDRRSKLSRKVVCLNFAKNLLGVAAIRHLSHCVLSLDDCGLTSFRLTDFNGLRILLFRRSVNFEGNPFNFSSVLSPEAV